MIKSLIENHLHKKMLSYIKEGDYRAVENLLKKGVSPNAKPRSIEVNAGSFFHFECNFEYETPLFEAVEIGNYEMVSLLLSYGAVCETKLLDFFVACAPILERNRSSPKLLEMYIMLRQQCSLSDKSKNAIDQASCEVLKSCAVWEQKNTLNQVLLSVDNISDIPRKTHIKKM